MLTTPLIFFIRRIIHRNDVLQRTTTYYDIIRRITNHEHVSLSITNVYKYWNVLQRIIAYYNITDGASAHVAVALFLRTLDWNILLWHWFWQHWIWKLCRGVGLVSVGFEHVAVAKVLGVSDSGKRITIQWMDGWITLSSKKNHLAQYLSK